MTNYATEFCSLERSKGFEEACVWMQKKIKPEVGAYNNGNWSKDELKALVSMLNNNYKISEISSTLNKTPTQIYAKRRRLNEKGALER
mgnify:CR=1 FL=1